MNFSIALRENRWNWTYLSVVICFFSDEYLWFSRNVMLMLLILYCVYLRRLHLLKGYRQVLQNFLHTLIYLEGLLYFLNLTLLELLSITDLQYNNICSLKASFLYSIRKIRYKHPLIYEKESKIYVFTNIPYLQNSNLMYRLKFPSAHNISRRLCY